MMSVLREPTPPMLGSPRPNHILLFTVLKPSYPITTSVLSRVCSGLAYVSRIVIAKRRGPDRIQAMVEFRSVSDAQRVKDHLQGVDIYDECCTMQIEFAFERVFRLRVARNDDDSWDFTEKEDSRAPSSSAFLNEPSRAFSDRSGDQNLKRRRAPELEADFKRFRAGHEVSLQAPPLFNRPPALMSHSPPFFPTPRQLTSLVPPPPPMFMDNNNTGPVCMVYELNMAEMSPQRLFNLFSLFGDVLRIKFLSSKTGSAMIEMSDPLGVARAAENLNEVVLFGSCLVIRNSRQTRLIPPHTVGELENGCPSFGDFERSPHGSRFGERRQSTTVFKPSKVLHFRNLSPESDEEKVKAIFVGIGASEPKTVRVFNKGRDPKALAGLIQFASVQEASEAVALCNHTEVKSEKNPSRKFTLKLCFSVNEKID